ncbi:MerR family transcriptional regulator [Streptomyces sp. BHT-5-2]|nr:MerR family transcriptional regulator [Streptomyces sp. BHT-5-2]
MWIGELADLTGVSPRSLRYYEQQGLLAPQPADSGYRAYDALEAIRVANIKELLDAGLTLEDVRPALEKGFLDASLCQSPYIGAGWAVRVGSAAVGRHRADGGAVQFLVAEAVDLLLGTGEVGLVVEAHDAAEGVGDRVAR